MKTRYLIVFTLFVLLGFVPCNSKEQSRVDSTVVRNGVPYKLADFPLYMDPIYDGPSDPTVCYNREKRKWYMYYTSRRVNMNSIKPIERIHGTAIGIAESSDGGATWKYIGNCKIDYKPDANPTYWAPEIFEYNHVYHMFLSYVPGIFNDWNHPRHIVHLTSQDGINWKTYGVVDLGSKIIDACVYHLPNGTWRMWYKNESENSDIIWYADSSDLYKWIVKGPAKLGGIKGEGPNVIFWHNKYYMIVDEWKGLSVYSSDDATNWKKQSEYLVAGIPLKSNSDFPPRYVDGSRGNHADVEVVGDHAYMFYFSQTPSNVKERGLAVYVQELIYHKDGSISCEPTQRCYINLNASRRFRPMKFDSLNPMVHDPVAIKQGDTYHIFFTGQGISSLSSKDFKNWKVERPLFSEDPVWIKSIFKDFRGGYWAPDILFYQNRYHLFYACSAFAKNTSIIGHASSPTLDPSSPDYHWTDHGMILQSIPYRDLWNAIDPNVIIDKEGNPWMDFGSFWGGIKLVKLTKDLMQVAQPEEWHSICRRPRTFTLDDNDPGDGAVEAPFISIHGDYYYLYVSFDYCCRGLKSDYKVAVGRSKSIAGPYLDKDGKSLSNGGGSIILKGNKDYAGIGHCAVYTFDGKDYILAHGYSIKDGGMSKLIVREIKWDKDGWPVITM